MHLQSSLLPAAFVALSLSLVSVIDGAPVRQLIKREIGNVIESRAEVPDIAQPKRRNVVIKRGYYVGQRKPSSPPAAVKRDRFAPYGYPVSVVRRDNDKHPSVSAGSDDDDNSDAPANATSKPSPSPSPPSPPPSKPASQNGIQSALKPDASNNTVTLPKGVTATSNGFLFIPVSQQVPTTTTNSSTTTGSPPSVTRQTFYINIEAAQGGNGQTFKLDTVSGGGAKNDTSAANVGSNAKQGASKSSSGDKDDESDKKDKKPSSTSAPPSPSGNSTANGDGVKKIIFKPLQDPDGGSSNNTVASPNVKAADAAETQDLKDVNNGDDKASSGKSGSSGDGSGAKSGSTGSNSPAPAANSTSASPPASTVTSGARASNNSSSSAGDNYFLFPVDKDKQQVDLSKGDMIAYVEHPQSAAKKVTQRRRDVDLLDEAGYRREAQGDGILNSNSDFARRAKDFFKRNLVNGKPGVRPEYWRGQRYEEKENRARSEDQEVRRDTVVIEEGDIVLKRSSLRLGEGQRIEPGFFLVRRAPQESLEEAERRYRR